MTHANIETVELEPQPAIRERGRGHAGPVNETGAVMTHANITNDPAEVAPDKRETRIYLPL